MTLNELYSKLFVAYYLTTSKDLEPAKIYVFKNEDDADEWIKIKYSKDKNKFDYRSYNLAMVIQSDYKLESTLNERWYKANVEQFYAVGVDTLVAVVTPYEGKEEEG